MSDLSGRVAVLVRGANDVASAVGVRLFRAGMAVVLHESSIPTTSRRGMSFADAVFDGRAQIDGVVAIRPSELGDIEHHLATHKAIPVMVCPLDDLLEVLPVGVMIDARMRKHIAPETQVTLAPLTVGLGPNFVAGITTHLAVETAWGDDLGKVIESGPTRPLSGEPQEIAGHARDRYVYAPVAGLFRTSLHIGESVIAGQRIANIDSTELHAPLDGVLRGLTHDGVEVAVGAKVIEVDPRGPTARLTGLGERPMRIADGTLEAVERGLAMRDIGDRG